MSPGELIPCRRKGDKPEIRALIAPCRSGTTAFLQAMSQHPNVHCLYQPVKSGLRETFYPDYSVYEADREKQHQAIVQNPGKVYVFKETVGRSNLAECMFPIFPDEEAIFRSKPVFLFRDPLETWNSWKKHGWDNLNYFLISYRHVYSLYQSSRLVSDEVTCLTLRNFMDYPEQAFVQICENWGLTYDPQMLNWDIPFEDNPKISFSEIQKTRISFLKVFPELYVAKTYGVQVEQRKKENFVTPREEEIIRQALLPLFNEVAQHSDFFYPFQTDALAGM